MSNESPIESALEAERKAKRAVNAAREEAAAIRQKAREQARQIERKAEERVKNLHGAMDAELEARRKSVETQGAGALRAMKHDTTSEKSLNKAIEEVVAQLMAEASDSKAGRGDAD